METCEKIICCDRDGGDNLATALLANNNGNNWMNNPFAYLMFLALFRNGWGNENGNGAATQGIETQSQLNAIRTQLADNQNANCLKSAIDGNGYAISQLAQTLNVDFNTLQKCCCDVQAAIQQVSGQVGFSSERVINAANMGDCNIIQALKDCCCGTQRQIADFRGDVMLQACKDTAELRNGQRDLGVALSSGFAQVGYETQRQTCDIINNQNANTQRIVDTLNNHWKDEQALQIQDLKFQLSQERQTRALMGGGYGNGCNNGCGCGY